MIGFVGAILIGVAVAWAAERYGFTRLGLFPAIVTAVGGAVIGYMVLYMFGIGLGGRGLTAVIGAIGGLVLLPGALRK